MAKKELWMQEAFAGAKKHPGRLHRQLGIPLDKKIPQSLLAKIKKAQIGETIENPTKIGKRRIKVTRLLKKRAVPVHTANKIRKQKQKSKKSKRKR